MGKISLMNERFLKIAVLTGLTTVLVTTQNVLGDYSFLLPIYAFGTLSVLLLLGLALGEEGKKEKIRLGSWADKAFVYTNVAGVLFVIIISLGLTLRTAKSMIPPAMWPIIENPLFLNNFKLMGIIIFFTIFLIRERSGKRLKSGLKNIFR